MTTLEQHVSDDRRAPSRPRRGARVAVIVAGVVLGGLLLALLVRPYHSDFGGGDSENYLFNGFRQAQGHDSAYRFLPPEWEDLDAEDRDALRAAFVDEKSRMYRLAELPVTGADAPPEVDPRIARKKAVVDEQGRIGVAHDNLYSVVLSVAVVVHADDAPYLVNAFLTVLTALLLASLARRVTGSRWAWVAGGLLVVLPASVIGVRETRTEAFAAFLLVAFAWWTERDRAVTAWPGLLLVALWMTRHEAIVPLLLYLAWAGLRRRRGAWVVVAATVAAAYLFPWGPASAGDLFPGDRDLFSALPDLAAWMLPPAFAGFWLVAGRRSDSIDAAADRLRALGDRPELHRLVWGGLVAVALLAEVLRRTLETGEPGWLILRGATLSTLGVLVDTAGWPVVVVGAVGLVAFGHRLAHRLPWIVALVTAPQAMVLLRAGTSGDSIWNPARRFQIALIPVLLLGVALVVTEIARRVERPTAARLGATGVAGACLLGLLGPTDRLPDPSTEPDRGDARAFHAVAEGLPEGALVLLDRTYGSMSAQPTLRFLHGRWSFVAWDDGELAAVLPRALAAADRPVLAEDTLVGALRACGATVGAERTELPVEHGASDGEVVVLRPVTGACRTA